MWGTGNLGGANSLNFKIVGGSSLPDNARENTIWVNTETPIDGYTFSSEKPAETADGMIWVKTGTESKVAFSATKKNPIMLYPVAVKQYISGDEVSLDASLYKGGAWVKFSTAFDGVLFDNGDEKPDITGGWVNVTDGELITASNNGVSSISGLRHTANMIDLTNFSTVKANLKTCSGKANLIITKVISAGFADFTKYKQVQSVTGEIALDVSAYEGEYYVAMAAGVGSASFTADKVWLVDDQGSEALIEEYEAALTTLGVEV